MEGRRIGILARNVVTLGFTNLFSRLLMVTVGILLARAVGEVDYGQFAQAIAWTLVLGYLGNLGLERLITREVARAPAQTDRLVHQALILKLGACTLLPPVLVGLNALLGFHGQMASLFYLLGAYSILDSFRLLFCAVLEGRLRMELELRLTSAQAVGVFVLAVLALWRGQGVIGVAWAHVVAGGLSVVLGYYLLARIGVAPLSRGASRGDVGRLLRDTVPFGLYILFVLLYERLPIGLIGLWINDAAAGWFNAAYIIAVNLLIFPRIILNSSFPLLANARRGDPALGAQTARYLILSSLPAALGLGLAAPAIIQFLYGPAYAPAATVLEIVSISVPFAFLNIFLEGVLAAVDRQRTSMLVRGLALALLVGSSLPLVSEFGYRGMAWTIVLTGALACLMLCLALARDIQWRVVTMALWKASLAGAFMATGMWVNRGTFVLFRLGLGAGLYLLALWALRAFSPTEVSAMRVFVRRTLESARRGI